eukprot:GFUD01066981.1.p1 GENE.GFUD01066981.1~~GFUD01066981.1.p1  ORF type:complete len:895 (+),score=149.92 GFUD01066981.1:13-2697(+)
MYSRLHILLFLLYLKNAALDVFHETTAAFATPGCCYEKQVGTERYVLVNDEDTATAHNDCNSNCVYEKKTAPSSRYCFKAGNDPFHCRAEQEPTRSILPIIEGNESFVQDIIFQKETGVLVLKVPPHKDYTESVYVFEEKSGTSLLKTGDVCQLADLPTHFNVSASAERFESQARMNQGDNESEKVTSFVLKTRDSRLGSRRRAELVPDVQDLCDDVPLVKTKDLLVNETEFEKFKKGEVIFVERKSSRRCLMHKSCTIVDPSACGWGWVNPAGGGLSFHEVSAGSICVTCNMNFTAGPLNQGCNRTLCNCTEIIDKNSLVDCSIVSQVNSTIEIEGWNDTTTRQQQQQEPILITQSMVYNRNYERRSITISSPAHKDIGALDVVMHAHKDGWWHNGIYGDGLENNKMMKLGNTCFISTLNANVFPVDIAIGIQEIKKGNDVTTAHDEVDTHAILRDLGPLTRAEEIGLHEDIQSRCLDSNFKKNVETPITKIQSDDLKNGKIIFRNSVPSRSNCQLQTAVANTDTGCWRYPNPDNKSKILWVHQIIHSITEVPCCLTQTESEFPTCCQDNHPEYRECKDIMAAWNNALFVSSGYDSATLSSVEILQEGIDGNYKSKQVNIKGGCFAPPDLPLATSSATGSLFNGSPHVCVGYKDGEPSSKCFGFKSDGSWRNAFNLTKPLTDGGSSVTFGAWDGVDTPWWIVGGEPSGVGTEVWGGDPPAEIFNITLPAIIHTPCMAKINEYEAFVTAIPKPDSDSSQFAWIFNIQTNNWTRLPDTLNQRVGSACGVIKNITGKYVVLAGGWESSTTEIFNLETKNWTMGPSLGVDTFGGSMVSVSDGQELLLVGGYSTAPLSDIRKLGPSMSSWETVGQLDKARYDAVALGVPVGDLPPLCP